jgi:hypothetical protein
LNAVSAFERKTIAGSRFTHQSGLPIRREMYILS